MGSRGRHRPRPATPTWSVPAGTHLDRGGDPHHAPVGTERTVAFMTQTLALTGVDRLDDRAGELVVVD